MRMYFIILSFHELFDYNKFVKSILDDELKRQLESEMAADYHIRKGISIPKKSKKKKLEIVDVEPETLTTVSEVV
jgi:hypothetical protein